MGGVVLLHPQNCLKEPILCRHNPNPKVNRMNRRKRSPTGTGGTSGQSQSRSPPTKTMVTKIPAVKDLVMGQVKILKRGEDLSRIATSDQASDVGKIDESKNKDGVVDLTQLAALDRVDDPALTSTERLGPDPAVVSKQIGVLSRFYAGSAFVTSPSPSSLPIPGFFSNNKVATSDLLRMLRLNLT